MDQSVLSQPIPINTKQAIVSQFWPAQQTIHRLSTSDVNFEPYWKYYNQKCSDALHDGGRHVAIRTHNDVLDCVSKLRGDLERDEIKTALRARLSAGHVDEDEMLTNSIDLAASLLLMTSFGSYGYGFSGQSQVCWTKGSVRDALRTYFDAPPELAVESVKLERIFTGRNLERIAGLEIVWTDNLADHLRLADDDQRVHVFHHASFLEAQRQSQDSLLPHGLAEETLQTLALLFPSSDADTRQWLGRLGDQLGLDRRVASCGRLKTDDRRADRFRFWRDRLVLLKQVFDEARPNTISQWWYDRRNGVQWYTFWVAVIVLVLAVVQIIEGGMQVYASFAALGQAGGGGPPSGAGAG